MGIPTPNSWESRDLHRRTSHSSGWLFTENSRCLVIDTFSHWFSGKIPARNWAEKFWMKFPLLALRQQGRDVTEEGSWELKMTYRKNKQPFCSPRNQPQSKTRRVPRLLPDRWTDRCFERPRRSGTSLDKANRRLESKWKLWDFNQRCLDGQGFSFVLI